MKTMNFRMLALSSAVAACSLRLCQVHHHATTGSVQQRVFAHFHRRPGRCLAVQAVRLREGSRELVAKSSGVLVFPAVMGASLGVGAEYGRGALARERAHAVVLSTTAGSVGFQAGAQSKAVIYLFTTQAALDKFRSSKGWTAGADATVALATIGANGSIDTNTLRQPVVGFVMTNVGLEAGVSLSGAKISEIQP